jgi:DNA polymerase-3 subunit gamma/tau
VYIIDEVHMLTGESFNAFLKTLEEPPAHVVFILATTDAHKLPVTITSRAQRFGFRAIAPAAALTHLRSIANSEKIAIDDGALELIVAHGDGSFRDSISLLDQLSSLSTEDQAITRELVESVLGMASGEQIKTLLSAYTAGDRRSVIQQLSLFEQQGIAASIVASQLMNTVRTQITENPHLLKLLDSLISVASSPRPDMRLLVALLPPASVHKTVAAAVATELRPLAEEAVKTLPREENIRSKTSASKMSTEVPSIKEMSTKSERKTTANTIPNNTESKPDSIHAEKPAAESSRQSSTGVSVEFDWGGYVTYMKEHHVALASILAKCKAESDGTTLTVYTGTAFWKKKLDDIKYQPILHDALKTLAMGDLTIETVPSTMPPKDSQAAAVAAIMGGGEEVAL